MHEKDYRGLNVCIVTSWFPSKNRPSLGPFVYNFAKDLAKSVAKVSVITTLEGDEEKVLQQDGLIIYRISKKSAFSSMFRLICSISPDIVHVHAPNLFSSNAILPAKLKRIPLVATVHRAEIDKIGQAESILRKLVLKQFKEIIAVSNFTKSLALRAGVSDDRIEVIYNSCDEANFLKAEKSAARERNDLPLDRRIVLFVGNLIEIKGVYVLVEAIKILSSQIPNLLLVMIGNGKDRRQLELLVEKYAMSNSVKFVGWLPQKMLPGYYNAADVFVLPSLVEGHSVALLEAMAIGLPIVTSDVDGNKESIQDGINGFLFESGNPTELAKKLATLLGNHELSEAIAAKGHMVYSDKFSSKIQIESYMRIYLSLIQQGDNAPTVLLFDNSGLSHYTSYVAKGLAKYFRVILCGFSKQEYHMTGADKEGVEFCQVPEMLPSGRSLISKLAKPLLLFGPLLRILVTKRYDIVHIQGHLPMFFLYIPFLKISGKRIWWTVHDVRLRPSSKGIRGKLELLFITAIAQPSALARFSDSIIVHGSSLKEQLVAKGINANKIYVTPHPDYRYLLNEDNRNTDTTQEYVLLFGRLKPYKGINNFIKAARIVKKSHRNFNVLIAGKGDASYFENLLTDEDRKYIHIRNEFIPNSEIPTIFRKAKFVVLPYTDASQSGVIPLAYTFSKPVVASNVGSIAESVVNGQTGFVFEAGNVDQLAECMLQLLEDSGECAEMGKRAHQKMLHEMSLERYCEIINDIYKRH